MCLSNSHPKQNTESNVSDFDPIIPDALSQLVGLLAARLKRQLSASEFDRAVKEIQI